MAFMPAHLQDLSNRADYEGSQDRAIFATTSEAILRIGGDFIIKESNPAFLRMMGWQDQPPINRTCMEVLHCRDNRQALLCGTAGCPLQQAKEGETPPPVTELYWETRSKTKLTISASFTPHRLGNQLGAVVVARDDTLLNAANRVRANFISMVSHELRTPLNSINGFVEVVLEGQVGPLNSRQQEFLGYVQTSALQLTTLVEDILFISKADSGQFVLRPSMLSVGHLLHQAIQSVVPEAEKARVHIAVSAPEDFPALWGDELRLCQVFTNLLHNAIKFSPPESEIAVTVADRGAFAEFAIQDQGTGVAPEEHARVFERFYQSESSQHAHGYGLGLAIAKLIVEQHHGRIWIESGEGQGATFSFTVPFGPTETEASNDSD
jgi:two-component system phosphate regulon sensor histidine kinase PhoR